MEQGEFRASVQQAASFHQAGNLKAARAAYEALLQRAPEHPGVLSLLSRLALQEGEAAEGRALLKRALAGGGEPKLYLRNLNSYLALLLRRKRESAGEVQRLVAAGLPDWPGGSPDAAERSMLLSLATLLLLLDQPGPGARLLEQAFPDPGEDADVLNLAGRLRLALGDAEGAMARLASAARLAPDRPAALIALSAAQDKAGRQAESRATTGLIASRFPYHAEPRRDSHTAAILILNPPPRRIQGPATPMRALHFRVNYAGQLPDRVGDRYRFLSVFSTVAPEASPWEADAPSLVLNNLTNEQELALPGMHERIRGLVDRIGLPVINRPELVARISREENARRLAGIPGLKVPRLTLYRRAETSVEAVIEDIGKTIGYPVILRARASHQGSHSLIGKGPKSVHLAANPREARDALAETNWAEFYAIEFVDLRRPEGWYRKIRAIFMGDEIIIQSGGFFGQWMVSGWRQNEPGIAFYRANPEAFQQACAIMRDPERELGTGWPEPLGQIRDRLGLDIFGMDFDIDHDGQVVLFEATPAMIFPHPRIGAPEDLWLPEEPYQRIHAGFRKLVERRLAEAAP